MIKKIREYIDLQRRIQFEVLETLATICRYLEWNGRRVNNPFCKIMPSHFRYLKELSEELRSNMESDNK